MLCCTDDRKIVVSIPGLDNVLCSRVKDVIIQCSSQFSWKKIKNPVRTGVSSRGCHIRLTESEKLALCDSRIVKDFWSMCVYVCMCICVFVNVCLLRHETTKQTTLKPLCYDSGSHTKGFFSIYLNLQGSIALELSLSGASYYLFYSWLVDELCLYAHMQISRQFVTILFRSMIKISFHAMLSCMITVYRRIVFFTLAIKKTFSLVVSYVTAFWLDSQIEQTICSGHADCLQKQDKASR